ncbi:hypothetical protein G7046_g5336 [Stylonectria norvegica]|nr:hypothetical protein G7046_g5336 [Stylonectria norvegica]
MFTLLRVIGSWQLVNAASTHLFIEGSSPTEIDLCGEHAVERDDSNREFSFYFTEIAAGQTQLLLPNTGSVPRSLPSTLEKYVRRAMPGVFGFDLDVCAGGTGCWVVLLPFRHAAEDAIADFQLSGVSTTFNGSAREIDPI